MLSVCCRSCSLARAASLTFQGAAQEGTLPPGLDPALDEEGDEESDDDDDEAPAAADAKLPMKIGPKLTRAPCLHKPGRVWSVAELAAAFCM